MFLRFWQDILWTAQNKTWINKSIANHHTKSSETSTNKYKCHSLSNRCADIFILQMCAYYNKVKIWNSFWFFYMTIKYNQRLRWHFNNLHQSDCIVAVVLENILFWSVNLLTKVPYLWYEQKKLWINFNDFYWCFFKQYLKINSCFILMSFC